jgi:hypothetical protein
MTTTQPELRATRSAAYGRIVATLREVGPSKLLPAEQETIREAADALLFTEDPLGDELACEAVRDVEALAEKLVATGRWNAERADALVNDVVACGSVSPGADAGPADELEDAA